MKNTLQGLALGLGIALASGAASAGSAADAMQVSGLYARAIPPGQPNSAAFLTLKNTDSSTHALVAGESSAAKIVELHTHTMDGGMMRMRPVEKIEVPAGEQVKLQPSGLHVMLIGLDHQLMPGEEIDLVLIYEDGSRKAFKAPVRRVQAMLMQHQHH